MSKLKKVRDLPQDVETIIHSMENYALGDIKFIKSRPIAAFILSICFIEQLSTYLYHLHGNNKMKPERFIKEYMKEYDGIDLYDKSRHSLVHNYSSRGQFDIDNRGYEDVPYTIINEVIFINTDVFINYLVKAFESVKKDLRIKGSEKQKHAEYNSMYYPVLIDSRG